MNRNRRKFLKRGLLVAGAAAGTSALSKLVQAEQDVSAPAASAGPAQPALTHDHHLIQIEGAHAESLDPQQVRDAARQGIPNRKWIMVIDLSKCDGCGHCMDGCEKMHFIPPGRKWIKVLRMKDSRYSAPYFFPQPCFDCDNPPCTKVCPVNATYKRSDGLVLVDNDRCIGCRFCIAGCPYSVRVFNWGHPSDPPEALQQGYSPEHGFLRRVGTVEKCDFCADMAREGKLPACAAVCPMGVIYYGDQNEDAVTNGLGQTVRLTKLLTDNAAYRQFEELGTQPRCYYLPPKNRLSPGPGEGGQ